MNNSVISALLELNEMNCAEEATGCLGAGDYRAYARALGYDYLEVLDWSNSGGDWQFIVSKDAHCWYVMTQGNNFPQPGFTRTVDTQRAYFGDADEVLNQIWEEI